MNKGVGNGNETKGMEPWGRGGNSKAASWMGRGKKTVWQALLFADPAKTFLAFPEQMAKNHNWSKPPTLILPDTIPEVRPASPLHLQ